MFAQIQSAMSPDGSALPVEPLSLNRTSGHNGRFAASDLVSGAVCSAVAAVQLFCRDVFGGTPAASVDRVLVDQWCQSSVTPVGWSLPPKWGALAGDYRTRDGWIRLHTNAPHHRRAAVATLGTPETASAVAGAIRHWDGDDLEQAIVQAGGCAAKLRSAEEWRDHPQGRAVAADPLILWGWQPSGPARWQPNDPRRPLRGLRVLDLTRVLAGPIATRFLASFGADVLRIDPPDWFEDGNAIEMTVGKTCAGLDLKQPKGRARLQHLVQTADILVHGYRADALENLGFGAARLRQLNPALISVCLNAYGWQGPWRNRRGFDSLVQRSSGIAYLRDGRVRELPYQALDHATGYMMAAAALQALRWRCATGRVLSARLSLARQAKLLSDNAERHDGTLPLPGQVRPTAARTEATHWGPAERLGLPYSVDGVHTGWRTPARQLRSDPPTWTTMEVRQQ